MNSYKESSDLKITIGSRKFEVGSRKFEVGSRKSEVQSLNSEVGSRKSEVPSRPRYNKHFFRQVFTSLEQQVDKRMWFVFAIQLISGLLMFQPARCLKCDQTDWVASLDRATWSTCPKRNTYLRGLYRNVRKPGDERVGRIEHGRCCTATEPSCANQPATCSNANWLHTLDR